MTDFTPVLEARITELERQLKRQKSRTYLARKSRNMWRVRARDAERAANGSPYLRRRIRELEPLAAAHTRWLAQIDRLTA